MKFPKESSVLLAICFIGTAAIIFMGLEIRANVDLIKRMGKVINCQSAITCYQDMIRRGGVPDEGCGHVFSLIDPEECSRIMGYSDD